MILTNTKRFVIFLFLVFSIPAAGQVDHFDSTYFEHQRFAHRGGYASGPENTLHTILTNLSYGITAIEIDVHLTRDNQLVLFHDYTINRILSSDIEMSINDLTLSELKEIPLRDSSAGVQYVCSLKELIDTLIVLIPSREKLEFLLEVDFKPNGDKTKKGVDALLAILEDHRDDFGDRLYNYFFVSTFYPGVLSEIKKRDPKIVTAFAVNSSAEEYKVKARLAILLSPFIIKKNNVRIIEPNMCLVTKRFVKKWHRRGILINTYTVNTTCQKDYLKELKLNIAYTTNCPLGTCIPDPSDQLGKPKKWCKKCL